jgi:hypothetical protein
MKHYLLFTGMTEGSLPAIVVADDVKQIIGEPDFIIPVNPKIFWARSSSTEEKAASKIKVLEDLGYQKDFTFDARGLVKILFSYLSAAK